MVTYFDKEKLTSLIESVYNVTGITISVYDKDFNIICTVKKASCAFCNEVRTHATLAAKCRECDAAALKRCKETKLRYSYKCHMGLVEVATPIIYNDDILGFILFGQVTASPTKTDIRYKATAKAKELAFPKEELLSKLSEVRGVSDKYISSVSDIVKMAAEYIVLNKILSYKENTEKQIEEYIKENLKNGVSIKNICREFNICATTLYNMCVENFGCGAKEYIGKCKIKLAKQMLSDGKSISETAEDLGFCDTNYFVRFFKAKAGQTPRQYKNKL